MTTGPGPRRSIAPHLLWAALVTAAVVLAAQPGDPGPVPAGWLLLLGALAVLSARGSAAAGAALLGLNGLLAASAALLVRPVDGRLTLFYVLVWSALGVLIAARWWPAAGRRTRWPDRVRRTAPDPTSRRGR